MGAAGAVFGGQFSSQELGWYSQAQRGLDSSGIWTQRVALNVLKWPFSFLLQLVLNPLCCRSMTRISCRLRGGGTGVGQALGGKLVRRFRIQEVELSDGRVPIHFRYEMQSLLLGIKWTKLVGKE